jgi:uncharacterized Zn-binding protein involved in type VI secretion
MQGSPNVMINGRPAHRQGDMWMIHCCPKLGCHTAPLAIGSPTVYTNGRMQGRRSDLVGCGSMVVTSSFNVFVGDSGGGGGGQAGTTPKPDHPDQIEKAKLIDEPEIDKGVLVYPYPTGKPTPEQIQQSIANGHNPYLPPPSTKEEDATKPPNTEIVPVTCEGLQSPFGDSTRLTTNFSLGDMTTKTTSGSHRLRSQHGLSEAEIACNLKKLAENVLEPLKTAGYHIELLSGFRTAQGANESGNISQHEKGQAVDIKFPGKTKPQGYYEMAQYIRDNIPFDQLILEYNGPGSMWVHVSYSASLRRIILTRVTYGVYKPNLLIV